MMHTWRSRRIIAVIAVIGSLMIALTVSARAEAAKPDGRPAIILADALVGSVQGADAPIEVRFVTEADTQVDLGSLHVWVHRFVGWIDVTQRLLRHPRVRVGVWGIHLDGGVLPAGEHLVRLSLQDMKERAVEAIQTIRIADNARRM